MLETLAKQFKNKLPFVAYRKPNAILTKAILQHDDSLHTVSDFTESGFVFAPFDNTKKAILLPFDEILEEEIHTKQFSEINNVLRDPSAEAHKKYVQLVQKSVDTIQHSEIEKIVLSRKEEISAVKDHFELFEQLLHNYPTAYVYLWYHPKVGMWAGATPETLVHVQGSTLKTMSLAGTRKLQEHVVVSWDQKEIEEQQIVTDYIVDQLKTITTNLNVTEAETHQAGSLFHLCSIISGRMISTINIGDIIKTLHPTPAICGFPTEAAKSFILSEEGYDRKFYTGYLGELNERVETARNRNRKNQENSAYKAVRTNSELYVNLRCMELTHNKRILYIGGGITKDSNPESEWQETLAKSQIMKRVL
ncbi:chorismate-binding protein [Kordia sp. YSTF-M3]|uniref:Chorismate-binding protein n=1 Tax=Kordia aestuariivivens TaxID=2759037 RepID=A0ABR7Q7P9_9FLAO|nr:chorismate-binding protein [Kordia aestuariivivens]MBC8754575.1 chorismate-binding protein [Kordia aestuariivivens]